MTCKNCGRELEDGLTACPHCGSVLADESKDIDPVNTIVKSEISAAEEEAAASTSQETEPSAEKDVSSESISENEAEDNDIDASIAQIRQKSQTFNDPKKSKRKILLVSILCAVAAVAVIVAIVLSQKHTQINAFKKDTVEKQLGEAKVTVPVSWKASEEESGKLVYELKDLFGNQAYVLAQYEKAEYPESNYDLCTDKQESFERQNNVDLRVNYNSKDEESIKGVDDAKSFSYVDTRNGEKWSYDGYFIPISGEGLFTLICGVPEKTDYNRYEKDFESLYNKLYISFMANDDEQAIKKNTKSLGDKTYKIGTGTTILLSMSYNIAKDRKEITASVDSDSLEIGKWAFMTLNSEILDAKIEKGFLMFTAAGNYMGSLTYSDGAISFSVLCDENGNYSDGRPAWLDTKPEGDDVIDAATMMVETQKAFNEFLLYAR